MSVKRIAHFIDTFIFGGAERVLLDLCQIIPDYGYETAIFHFGHPIITKECEAKRLVQFIVPAHKYYKSTTTLPLFAYKFQSFLKYHHVNLLHSHLFGSIVGGALSASLARIPHIGTLHDVYMVEEKPSRIRLLQLAVFLGTKLVTVSEQMKEFYSLSGTFPKNTFSTIYNGISSHNNSYNERIEYRKKLGLTDRDFVIITVGRLVKLKGFDLLLQAIAETTSSQAKLIIIGEGEQKQFLENTTRTLGLTERVLFLGFRSDVQLLLNAADLFVLPSYSEGLSRSILEAMAAGLPCVVSNVGGNSELIEDRKSGFLFAPGDRQALRDCLNFLLANRSLLEQIGQNAKQRVQSIFSFEQMIKQYIELYQALLP